MSKFVPDPCIQQMRAARAGDIAIGIPTPIISTVGVAFTAITQPVIGQSISPPAAAPSLEPIAGTPSESPVVGSAFATTLSNNADQSKSLAAAESLETLSGTPSESPVVGVATGTSVV
jgi:hypothetical protein